MSATKAKASRREIRRAFGAEFQEAVETFMVAHEDGLKTHGEILRRSVLAGFWGRLRWLFFGIPTDPVPSTVDHTHTPNYTYENQPPPAGAKLVEFGG